MAKFSVSMNDELLAKIDAYADDNGMTRSGFLALAAKQYLHAMDAIPSLNVLLGKLANLAGDAAGMSQEEKERQLDLLEESANHVMGFDPRK